MMTSVWRAFLHAGSLKAGTPLEMASTPVTAAPPEANALASTKALAPMRRPVPASPTSHVALDRLRRSRGEVAADVPQQAEHEQHAPC